MPFLPNSKLPLRHHQLDAIQLCERFLRNPTSNHGALVALPTGSGKTAIMAVVAATASKKGITVVASPSDALCTQLIEELSKRTWDAIDIAKYGPPPKVQRLMPSDTPSKIGNSQQDGATVFVATMHAIASIHRENKSLYEQLQRSSSVVLIDEGHREPAPAWAQAVRGLRRPMILFSATPYRNDLRQFNVDSDFITRLSFADAVTSKTIRRVKLHLDADGRSIRQFAKTFVAKVRTLSTNQQLAESWKAVIHCANGADVEQMHNALAKITWAAQRGVMSFHDTFLGKGKAKLTTVPNLRDRAERFLVHQYKLLEGIDDPAIQILGVYRPFRNARALVQQIGRIVRNANGVSTMGHVIVPKDDDITPREWNAFLEFDSILSEQPLTDLAMVTQLFDRLPKIDYVLGSFRKRVPSNFNFPFERELLVRKSALVLNFPATPTASFQAVVDAVRESLIGANRWIAAEKADPSSDPSSTGHVFLAAIVSPSPLLSESAFMDFKLTATVVRQVGDFLFLSDSEGGGFVDLDDFIEGITPPDLTALLAGKNARLTALSALNTDIGHRALRTRAQSGYKLEESAPYLADHQYVLRRINGYVDGQHRSIGVTRSRFTVGRGELVPLTEFVEWTTEVKNELMASRFPPSTYIKRFSQPTPPPDDVGATPLHILLDIESLADRFNHPDHPDQDIAEATGLASDVNADPRSDGKEDYSFEIRVFGASHTVRMKYLPKRKRYELKSDFLEHFINTSNAGDSLLSRLNAQQSFRVITKAPGLIYAGKQFLSTDLSVTPGGRGKFLLDLLYPIAQLEHANSEKGDMRKAPVNGWSRGSVFDVIDRGLQGHLGAPFLSHEFDLIACTDLGREIADFVAVDSSRSRLVFLHAKAGESYFSASSLHVVYAQAVKNLDNVAARSTRLTRELQCVTKAWKHAGKSRRRMRVGTARKFQREAARVSSAPDGQREVWLVLGALLSKKKAASKLTQGTADADLVQIFMLLSSLYTQCVSVGANLRIFCSP